MLCRFKIISNRMLQFSFKSRSNYWKNNDIKIDKINNDVIQPEEIRKIIRKFQVKKEKFSESMYFKSWKTSVQAISLFQKFLNKNSNFLVNIEIFEEIKIFLENVIVSPFNSEDKFFYENFCGILNKIFSEFSNLKEIKLGNPSFFDENYNYSISSFRFLKSLLEIEYLVKNDYFINNFFQLIEVLSDQIIEKMFNNNNSIFVRNIKIIDEVNYSLFLVFFNFN